MESFNLAFSLIASALNFLGLSGVLFVTNKSVSQIVEHNSEIIFGYYSKMKIYLKELKVTLGQETETPLFITLVDRECDEKNIRISKDSKLRFEKVIDEFISFFKTHDWQIPLDSQFEYQLTTLIEKTLYLETGNISKFNSSVEDVKEEYCELIELIDLLIDQINMYQKKLINKAENRQQVIIQRIKRH